MPSATNFSACISDSLKKSLGNTKSSGGDKNVSQTISSSAKRSLLEKAEIKFVKAERDANSMLEGLKNKYVCLNRSHSNGLTNGQANGDATPNKVALKDDGIPKPRVTLYPCEKLRLQWESPRRVGAGLSNLGNTCFLNSVLQCLSYTPPLANHLLSGQHKPSCRSNGFCMLCELQSHVSRCLAQPGGAVKPMNILQKLKLIAKHLRWGRQEDAHEFLRYVVDGMQKSCLVGQNSSLEKLSKETTFVHQVFGGYLRSQVRCLQCKTTSNTYETMLDISVDLKGVNSVERALQKFVQPETLDIDNAYKCARCKKKVRALKQFTIHRAPKVLTVHLKRFDYHRLMGGKVSRHIEFAQKLDIRNYMSQRQGEPITYQLHGVLVHSGHSVNSGHYYCYVKAPNQTWYCMNDSHVSPTGLNSVLHSEAYILFYTRTGASTNALQKSPSVNSQAIKPNTPSHRLATEAKAKPKPQPSNNPLGTPVPRTGPIILKTPTSGAKSAPTTHKPTMIGTSTLPRRVSLTTLNDMISEDVTKNPVQNGTVTPKPTKLASATSSAEKGTSETESPKADKKKLLNGHSKHGTVRATTQKPAENSKVADGLPNTKLEQQKDNSVSDSVANVTMNGTACDKVTKKKKKKHKLVDADDILGSSTPSPKKSKVEPFSTPLTVNTKLTPNKYQQRPNQPSPTKFMSPPGASKENTTPKTSPSTESCKATTPNWQVSLINGRSHHPSESESLSSINSTTEWKVSTTPKQMSKLGENHVLKQQSMNQSESKSVEKRKKKKRKSQQEGLAGEMLNGSSAEETPNKKQRIDESVDEVKPTSQKKTNKQLNKAVRRVNETTPSPINGQTETKASPVEAGLQNGEVSKKKKKKKSAADMNGDATAVVMNGHGHGDSLKVKKKKVKAGRKSEEMANGDMNGDFSVSSDDSVNVKPKKKKVKVNSDSSILSNGDINLNGSSSAVEVTRKKKTTKKADKLSVSLMEGDSTETAAADEVNGEAQVTKTTNGKVKTKRRYSEPVVKQWDAKIEDADAAGLQRRDNSAPVSMWDGRKDSNIGFILERHSTMKGLGSGVQTWAGQKTEMARQVEAEKFTSHYRNGWYDDYEQQIDAGKTKKIKIKKRKHKGNQNHFQKIQNNTNTVIQLRREGKLPSLPDY